MNSERETFLEVEAKFHALLLDGHSRTRATQLVIEQQVAAAVAAPSVVLVEGLSDQIAFETLAARQGRNLLTEGVSVVAMGGATNVGRLASFFRGKEPEVELAGLYDSAAERHVARSLEQAGLGRNLDRSSLESLGFYVCVTDLEDELIRCLGSAKVEYVIESQGELGSLRRMQNEPFHRGGLIDRQLHRFIGRGRYRYARLLAEALDLNDIPQPFARLLARI